MMNHNALTRGLALVLLTLTTQACRAADAKDFEAREYKDADGNVLLYRIFKPAGYDAAKRYPLVLFLHGAGERGNNNTAQVRDALYWARPEVQKDNPCFVVAPQVPGNRQAFAIVDDEKAVGEWRTYKFTFDKTAGGPRNWLALVNAGKKGATPPPAGEFKNIKVYEEGSDKQVLDLKKLDFTKKEGAGKVSVSEDGSTLSLEGDVRVKAPLPYRATPKTVIEFDFRATAPGTSHSIALDADDFFDHRWANMDWSAKKGAMPKEASTSMRLTLEALEGLKKEFNLDEKRLYVTGLSMGGYGTWDVIARHPTLFAAAVPVCGGGDESTAPRFKDLPLWCFHGGADNVVPPERSRNMIEALKAAGGKPKYTEYPGVGHNSWGKAYTEPELPTWLFAQKRD